MRVSFLTVFLLVAAAGSAVAASEPDRKAASSPQATKAGTAPLSKVSTAQAGRSAPGADFVMADGRKQDIEDFRSTPVLVNLWATWCAPCIAEMPALDRLQKRAGEKLVVLPISQDLGGWKAVNGFAKPGRFPNLRFAVDSDNDWAIAVKAAGLPVTILYDERGKEVWRVSGPIEWDKVSVAALLEWNQKARN